MFILTAVNSLSGAVGTLSGDDDKSSVGNAALNTGNDITLDTLARRRSQLEQSQQIAQASHH